MAPPETAQQIMSKKHDPAAAVTAQTTDSPAVDPSTACCASLNEEQRDILLHTIHRAPGGRYCGGGKDMDRLVELEYMEYLGTPAWCPDPFYGVTRAGRDALRRHNAESIRAEIKS
jgi:hypothetical protein